MTDEKRPESGNGDSGKTAEPADDLITTRHSLGELRYTAVAGRVVLRQEVFDADKFDGHKPKAEVFITAYTMDDADPLTRPVTFAFNGGPGSSSVWLHMGLFGPRRVVMGDAGATTAPPYGLTDNHESLLHHSDVVFIDPVSTGYSRAASGEKAKPFHGYTGDLESVAEVIRLWTSRNNRWLSPKFLAGESYGTTRAAGLADYLQQRYSMYLNGVMLISPVLDFGTLEFSDHNDLPYSLFLPTYAAIAHYHGLHGDRTLREVLDEAESFAAQRYPWLLSRGSRLSEDDRAEGVATIARLSGVSPEYVDAVDLRMEHVRFYTELLRHKRLVVGRLDGRFTGYDSDYGRERFSSDPFLNAITGPYSAAFNHYVRAELEYHNDLHYEVLARQVHPWSYAEFEARNMSVADKLAAAMRANPHLRVHVACGYYDGGTPHAAAEHTMARLAIPAQLHDNIEFKYYESGHMMYVHEESRLAQSRDLAVFVTGGAA
jgi:carboxypeptidase C (cathepsin A)